MKKQKTLQLLLITDNTRNKQTIKEKDQGKNKKGIDPEVNKIVSCGKKCKKMFHALHKVDMRACYAKQKVILARPYHDRLMIYPMSRNNARLKIDFTDLRK